MGDSSPGDCRECSGQHGGSYRYSKRHGNDRRQTHRLLKVDIEKSEADVFLANPATWLPLVRNIAIELHGPACTHIFRAALSNYSFLERQRGEVTFCLGMHPKANGSAALG
jgi:hypothetical protein